VESQRTKAARFLASYDGLTPLLVPNPWDQGSARLFTWLGFEALATTSSGFAATRGRLDGSMSRDEMMAHVGSIVEATALPVSADLEHGFGDDPTDVAETVALALGCGLAGCSIEDSTGEDDAPLYGVAVAAERLTAAAAVAHAGPVHLVLTGRAENHLHGIDDLGDTIDRLQAYQEAGADVLYAPGLSDIGDIRRLVASVDRPVNVLARPGGPSVAELADAGVARVSVGGALCFAGLEAVTRAATEFLQEGTFGFLEQSAGGREAARAAFVE
jgi:2-methylisocitrate lyase-like PEP mutase family enzyme